MRRYIPTQAERQQLEATGRWTVDKDGWCWRLPAQNQVALTYKEAMREEAKRNDTA